MLTSFYACFTFCFLAIMLLLLTVQSFYCLLLVSMLLSFILVLVDSFCVTGFMHCLGLGRVIRGAFDLWGMALRTAPGLSGLVLVLKRVL